MQLAQSYDSERSLPSVQTAAGHYPQMIRITASI